MPALEVGRIVGDTGYKILFRLLVITASREYYTKIIVGFRVPGIQRDCLG